MDLDPVIQTFLIEAKEQLEEMEEKLLSLEQDPGDTEAVNAVFRAAHTIKGSGGMFGFEHLVAFTHEVESVLMRMRKGELAIDQGLISVLLSCSDHIRLLVDCTGADGENISGETGQASQKLVNKLFPYGGKAGQEHEHSGKTSPGPGDIGSVDNNKPGLERAESGTVSDNWHISLRFNAQVLKNGMDPLSFIRFLATVGDIKSVHTLVDNLLAAGEAFDPENCYLGFEVQLYSRAERKDIEEVFEFVRDDCTLTIIAPHSKTEEYITLINSLADDDAKLGQILLQVGALTPKELESILQTQMAMPAEEEPVKVGELIPAQGVDKQVVDTALNKQKQSRERQAKSKANESTSMRIDAEKLDSLINLVGELVIAQANSALLAKQSRISNLIDAMASTSSLIESIRDNCLKLRMVPIGQTFSRFQRVVRDISLELDKDIRLTTSGEDTELDKSMVEKLVDPLMHLVRNSMDHGIENAEQRLAAGKPEYGQLALRAYHDSGNIVIEVSDDGQGITKKKVIKKAIENSLITSAEGMADYDIYRLIFEPGFSTAETISNISGRGVGMDVVKQNIEQLKGTIEIDSRPGQGLTMRIRVPLTLAIIDGFLLEISNSQYVLPLNSVIECLELSESSDIKTINRNLINLRGEVLPIVRLRELFACQDRPPPRQNIIVVRYGNRKGGVLIDRSLGEYQTVIKPLSNIFKRLDWLAGSTILGSGEVAMILDVAGLFKNADLQASGKNPGLY
ncbi:chemotaxis protein CheA [Thalassomonas actiniarum]|uniref:Chemotaxis protein CheA n=1 Tax=Thalassomonas actiniarum TaxID=485447 RepID=A0AAE9YRW2_9GAMM|nr:chemotaxis protein CheA [Thalassomonas actiniarum]WDE00086.1 chemotaxis protein CheA [Thalassomonas actiniarum]